MTIVAFVPNLFDRSRFQGSATFVESIEELESLDCSLLLVDIDRCSEIESYCKNAKRSIGFGSHVNKTVLTEASDAGCEKVMTRSAFFKNLNQILEEASE